MARNILSSFAVSFQKSNAVLQRKVLNSTVTHGHPRCSYSTTTEHSKGRWHLYSAVCLERLPVITAPKAQIEEQFEQVLTDIEEENSRLSDHEVRHIEDLRLLELKKREDYEETEVELVRVTAQDEDDRWAQELASLTPTDRITDADIENDLKSIDRKLDRKLILLVKQQLGEKQTWVLPQSRREEGESMRQSAEKALSNLCGSSILAQFLGNAPCGFIKYNYPPGTQTDIGVDGAKVFFFKAHLLRGQLEESSDITDYSWLTKEELCQYLNPKYYKEVDKFILDL